VDEALATPWRRCSPKRHLRVTALRIARREAESRIAGYQSERLTAETRVRAVGTRIEVDVDVELSLVAEAPAGGAAHSDAERLLPSL